jgi:hypothetical protein
VTDEGRVGHTNLLDRYDEIVDYHSLVAEQFASFEIRKKIRELVPAFGNSWSDLEKIIAWFQKFMTWDKTSTLKRFSYVPTLLKTQNGRCGEWAILFTAILNALNFRARLVFDFEDHVWTEVWFNVGVSGEWIHVDSTLNPPRSIDHPYTYFNDFHHKIVKILAFSPGSIEDVTERYRP